MISQMKELIYQGRRANKLPTQNKAEAISFIEPNLTTDVTCHDSRWSTWCDLIKLIAMQVK